MGTFLSSLDLSSKMWMNKGLQLSILRNCAIIHRVYCRGSKLLCNAAVDVASMWDSGFGFLAVGVARSSDSERRAILRRSFCDFVQVFYERFR